MYSELAAFYDAYTGDMEREKLADFLCVIFKEHGPEGLAQAAGFDRLTYFIDRRPQFIDI